MTITRTVTLGRANVPCSCHVCAFFNYSGEKNKVVLPFMREGLHTSFAVSRFGWRNDFSLHAPRSSG
jgi:hypothetical protein